MGSVKTERCQACQAVVNPAWETCVACHRPLTTNEIVIEPAAPNARPVYWERATGIVGPAQSEFLARVGTGPKASYWVVAQFEGLPVWINSIVLRSKKAFDLQVKPIVFEWTKETPPTREEAPRERKHKEETTAPMFPTHGNTSSPL